MTSSIIPWLPEAVRKLSEETCINVPIPVPCPGNETLLMMPGHSISRLHDQIKENISNSNWTPETLTTTIACARAANEALERLCHALSNDTGEGLRKRDIVELLSRAYVRPILTALQQKQNLLLSKSATS